MQGRNNFRKIFAWIGESFSFLRTKPVLFWLGIVALAGGLIGLIFGLTIVGYRYDRALPATLERVENPYLTLSARGYHDETFDWLQSCPNCREIYDELYGDFDYLTTEELRQAAALNPDNPYIRHTSGGGAVLIDGREDLEKMGFRLSAGAQELSDQTVYFSERFARARLMEQSLYKKQGDQFVPLTEMDEISGVVYLGKNEIYPSYHVAGIVSDSATDAQEGYYNDHFSVIYCTEGFFRRAGQSLSGWQNNFWYEEVDFSREDRPEIGVEIFSSFCPIVDLNRTHDDGDEVIAREEGVFEIGEDSEAFRLEANECLIPLNLYNKLFGTALSERDFYPPEGSEIPSLRHLGQTVAITVKGGGTEVTLPAQQVVGVTFYRPGSGESTTVRRAGLRLSDAVMQTLRRDMAIKVSAVTFRMNEREQIGDLIARFDDERHLISAPLASWHLKDFEEDRIPFAKTCLAVAIALLAVAVVLIDLAVSWALRKKAVMPNERDAELRPAKTKARSAAGCFLAMIVGGFAAAAVSFAVGLPCIEALSNGIAVRLYGESLRLLTISAQTVGIAAGVAFGIPIVIGALAWCRNLLCELRPVRQKGIGSTEAE